MADFSNQNLSLALYRYLRRNIVRTEGHVKQMRYMTAVRDNIESYNKRACITSGSFGEGLEMRGSDLDTVFVLHELFEVCEELKPGFNSKNIHFLMEIDDVKPSYSLLRLFYSPNDNVRYLCQKHNGKQYYSSALHKQEFLFGTSRFMHKQGYVFDPIRVHGPCITDEDGRFDNAISLHCKTWVSPVVQWITRSNNSWPSNDVKQSIINHGVIFVPIGVKGSLLEDLEWRLSFSVGEKLLINTFTHTQLLCYVLLKILLKYYSECEDLLCSYFLKTIIFWISEELPQSVWKPVNIIPCFMRCFSRLIYCVEYSVCLHYFIPENNLFEDKIKGDGRKILLEKLNTLYSYGWQCILFSNQFYKLYAFMSNFHITQYIDSLFVHDVVKLLRPSMLFVSHLYFKNRPQKMQLISKNGIFQTVICQQSSIKDIYVYYMSMCSSAIAQLITLDSSMSNNTCEYRQYKYCLSILLQNVYHDAVSGWLMLASFFYKTKQYSTALDIIRYSISKCTPEKLCHYMTLSDYQLLKLNAFKKKSYVHMEKIMLVEDISFKRSSSITPDELRMVNSISNDLCWYPSIVYAYFLKFLCHYHLNNVRQCQDSRNDLQRVIEEYFLISQSRFRNKCDILFW